MKNIIMFVVIISITCSFFAFIASAADDRGPMKIEANNSCGAKDVPIKVTDESGRPLVGAKVVVLCRNLKTDYGMTDNKGIFIYKGENTKSGVNEITAKKDNYGDASATITISPQCVPDTTTTVIIITSTTAETTTTRRLITTTTNPCNRNGKCEPLSKENYSTCPQDCSGAKDGMCDKRPDGICDLDCERSADVDCFCNRNGVCEPPFENYNNCPSNCMKGVKDNYCDKITDGVCDPDCPSGEDSDCKGPDVFSTFLPLGLLILVFVVIVVLNMRRDKKKIDEEKGRDDLIESLKVRLKNGEDPEVLAKELVSSGKDAKILELAEKRIWN